MNGSVFLAGLLLGLSVAAPVGPMGMLVINRTLSRGFPAGLAVGCGIAVGDAIYGALAASGVAAITGLALTIETPLRLLGGAFLIWLGVQSWRAVGRQPRAKDARAGGMIRSFVIAVGLTLTNPATILSFLAAFGALGLMAAQAGALVLVAGVFAGSALWWLVLCTSLSVARVAITPAIMAWIDRASAVVLVAFGVVAIVRAF